MRAFLRLAYLALLLTGCESHQPAGTVAKKTVTPPVATPKTVVSARIPTTTMFGKIYAGDTWIEPADSSHGPPVLQLAGQTWRVYTTAHPDSTRPLTLYAPSGRSQRLPAISEVGVDVRYTFELRDAHGRPRFTRTLRKADFAGQVYEELRTVAGASPPVFLRYWPARGALCFEVNFGRPETDEGLIVLVLLDARTGKLLHLASEKAFMNDCDCWPTLTADGQTLLVGKELLHANGRVTTLVRPDKSIAATRLVNDSTFLVVYEGTGPNESAGLANALLVNQKGQALGRFTFHGTGLSQSGGGFSLTSRFLPATQTSYLFDEVSSTFTLLPTARPLALRQLTARQLVPARPPRRPTEVALTFEPDYGPSATLYVDTLTQQVRGTVHEMVH